MVDRFLIIQRINAGRTTVAYALKTSNNDYIPVSKDMVLKLAMEGRVVNATAQHVGNSFCLKAKPGFDLSKLPARQMMQSEMFI